MIRQDCLSKCRRDRAYCHCKADAIRMFSDVIHVSTLPDIRLFLMIFGFLKPKFFFGGGVHKCGTPSLAKSFSPVLCWQSRRERVRPRRSDAWQSGSRRGTRFAFACVFAVIITALSARHYRSNASARKSRCRISRFSATVSSLVICVMPVSGRNVCLRPAAISAWLSRRLCAIVTLSSANP